MNELEIISPEEIKYIENIQRKMNNFFEKSRQTLYEREELVRLITLAILSKDHMFMYGPPGSAKSVVANALQLLTRDRPFFRYLMTDFTHYDAIFGKEVISTTGAMPKRVLDKKLPTAHYGFLDEIFKANAEILNSFLTILNERQFDDDYNGTINVPLCTVFAASNEFPRTSYLKALFERFPLRIPVPNIKDEGNRINIFNGEVKPMTENEIEIISEDDIEFVQKNYRKIKLRVEDGKLLNTIIDTLHDLMNPETKDKLETLYEISGRTMFKIGSMIRLCAYVNKRDTTNISDLLILRYMAWSNIFERASVLPKINQLIFGGESEIHGDLSKELESFSIPTLRYINSLRALVNGSKMYETEKEFNEFKFMLIEYLKVYKEKINGVYAIYNKLSECQKKESLVEENIFLHEDFVLDWRVKTSLIKVNSEKYIELINIFYQEFIPFEVNTNYGKKYNMLELINKTISIHSSITNEIKNWLKTNENYFAYKIAMDKR